MRVFKKTFIFLLVLAMFVGLVPTIAFAQGPIDIDYAGGMTIKYLDMGNKHSIPGAQFDVFKIADVDYYGQYTMTEQFENYPIDFKIEDPDSWGAVADDFKGYVYADKLSASFTGMTDENGELEINDIYPGIYLVVGYRATTPDNFTYFATPFLMQLPIYAEPNDWEYFSTVYPKSLKAVNPHDDFRDRLITRKVEVSWDDVGYESLRPDSVEVTLFCDGEIYDVVELTKETQWRYVWDNLDSQHEWDLAETKIGDKEVPSVDYDYTVNKTFYGITWLVVNKYAPAIPALTNNITVQKKITGDTPKNSEQFSFLLTAKDESCPMPEGNNGREKVITISGAGLGKFGQIEFAEEGTYEYTISEVQSAAENYTYDKSVYHLTYEAIKRYGSIVVTPTLTKDGKDVERIEFENIYTEPKKTLPQTGQLWWPVPVLFAVGLILMIIGITRHRKYSR